MLTLPFRSKAQLLLMVFTLSFPCFLGANGPAELTISDQDWATLTGGSPVVLDGPEGKERKALAAIIVPHSPAAVWNVIDDKESAVNWCDGLQEARVVESGEHYCLVYQEMKIGFLPGTFKYVIRHTATESGRRVDFERVSGSFKKLAGYWELYPIENGSQTLLLYQLAIEPGIPVPPKVMQNSLEKSLPEALVGLRKQVVVVADAKVGE